MQLSHLFSRRNTEHKADFRPDPDPKSPFAQMRRLHHYVSQDIASGDDIEDCDDALNALREYTYRKLFTGTSHEEYVQLASDHVDWMIRIHEYESDRFRSTRKTSQDKTTQDNSFRGSPTNNYGRRDS